MFFQRLANFASANKRVLGAASVAGFGYGAATFSGNQGSQDKVVPLEPSYLKIQNLFSNRAKPFWSMAAECETKQWQIYRREEVQKEARENKKVWVTYSNGVYDLTEFARSHPGGSDKLLMAKGGPIEPFWQMYPFHKNEQIIKLLADYKIGELDPRDVLLEKDLPDFKDLQTQNLGRSNKLDLLQKFPYCAQTPPEFMTFREENFQTPPKEMFERNHNLIPEIEIEDYELELYINGKDDENPITLTFDDLAKMPKHSVMAALACAGSKRTAVQEVFPTVKGLKWTNGAVGNSVYSGVPMRHILLEVMGQKEEDLVGKNLQLIAVAYDADFQGKHYEVSIPIENALAPENEVTLAYEMNGEPIPAVHGFPVRMISPGYIGVRSAKWLHKLIISTEEADSTPQRRDYKIVKDKDITKVDWNAWKTVYGQVINSAFATPAKGEQVTLNASGKVELSGWAHGNGETGNQVVKVQLRFNGAGDWVDADQYIKEDKPQGQKVFSWTLWKYEMSADKFNSDGSVQVECRAIGSDGEVQDSQIEDMYNVRGIMNNAFDKIHFSLKQ